MTKLSLRKKGDILAYSSREIEFIMGGRCYSRTRKSRDGIFLLTGSREQDQEAE